MEEVFFTGRVFCVESGGGYGHLVLNQKERKMDQIIIHIDMDAFFAFV